MLTKKGNKEIFICQNCKEHITEMETSHDVPIYLFPGLTRKERKNTADKFGRKNLCIDCHDKYEAKVLQVLFRNLLGKEIDLITTRKERTPYFPKIWRLDEEKKRLGIKICLKIAGDKI